MCELNVLVFIRRVADWLGVCVFFLRGKCMAAGV